MTDAPVTRALEVLRRTLDNPCGCEHGIEQTDIEGSAFTMWFTCDKDGRVANARFDPLGRDVSHEIQFWLTATKSGHRWAKAPAAIIETLRELQRTDPEAWAAATGGGLW